MIESNDMTYHERPLMVLPPAPVLFVALMVSLLLWLLIFATARALL